MTDADRIQDLMADLATVGLTVEEETELQALTASSADWEHEAFAFERAAAALCEALVPIDEPLPESACERFRSYVETSALGAGKDPATGPLKMPSAMPAADDRVGAPAWSWGGWVAAAACVLIGVAIAINHSPSPPVTSPQALQAFVSSHPNAATAQWDDWSLDGAPPEQTGITGDVVWDEGDQTGYLRLVGLEPNDPNREQYQLWIVDERGLFDEGGQSARISGAIFDADESGETIVRIDPSIPVKNAAAFAITIEPPGGVWVSDMKRRTVIAALGG